LVPPPADGVALSVGGVAVIVYEDEYPESIDKVREEIIVDANARIGRT
jgi:hypothetical protein